MSLAGRDRALRLLLRRRVSIAPVLFASKAAPADMPIGPRRCFWHVGLPTPGSRCPSDLMRHSTLASVTGVWPFDPRFSMTGPRAMDSIWREGDRAELSTPVTEDPRRSTLRWGLVNGAPGSSRLFHRDTRNRGTASDRTRDRLRPTPTDRCPQARVARRGQLDRH
jgi:hypothetical protein